MDAKLLLFDIDGTLLLGHGIPKMVFLEVIERRYPDFPNEQKIRFSGMTDPQIVQQLLSTNGYCTDISEELIEDIISEFVTELEKRMTPAHPPELLPGVKSLLQFCDNKADVYLGLVTGNVMHGARIKLTATGLYQYFAVGAFGSDNMDRNLLPPIAISRASKYYNKIFSIDQIWIIGDSVKDVQCAKVNGLKCLAVTTGFTSRDELEAEGPDKVLPDLSDFQQVATVLKLE